MIYQLPPELLFNIIHFLPCRDISRLRTVSRLLRHHCDAPFVWRSINLQPLDKYWQFNELRAIIDPHRRDIYTIQIEGVRDAVVQYILTHCHQLKHLVVSRWLTLSDHSLRLAPNQFLNLESIQFIGTTSSTLLVDASTLGKFIKQSPRLTHLVFGCQAHVHAETLISELQKNESKSSLKSVTLATKQTWNREHVYRFVTLYPTLRCVQLLPEAAQGFDNLKTFQHWISKHYDLDNHSLFISNQDLIVYSNTVE